MRRDQVRGPRTAPHSIRPSLAAAALALAALLGSCGASAPLRSDEAPAAPTAQPEAEPIDAELRESLGAGPNADCPRACELLEQLCEVSERVCAAAESAPDPDTQALCLDARGRCRSGEADVEAQCGPCPEEPR